MSTLKRYFFWTYERGSFHYDVMVTLILLFIFISPRFIDFRAKPVRVVPLRKSEVLVKAEGPEGIYQRFMYEIRVEDLGGAQTDDEMHEALLRVIQPIAGYVKLEGAPKPVLDAKGRIVAYEVTVLR
jgi:hypothetical protein